MDTKELTRKILEITNNSPYGWIDTDSSCADRIEHLIETAFSTKNKSKN